MIDHLRLSMHMRELLLELCSRAQSQEEHQRLLESVCALSDSIHAMTSKRQEEFDRAVLQG